MSANKAYARAYEEFTSRIRFDESFLETMYGSRFARHFYSDAERDAFRSRWLAR